jgi:hypothetical protein
MRPQRRRSYIRLRLAAIIGSLLAFAGLFGLVRRESEAEVAAPTPAPVATARPVFAPASPEATPTTARRPDARTRAS